MAPGLAAASIFTFRIAWNEFILAWVLTDRHTRTLPVAASLFIGQSVGVALAGMIAEAYDTDKVLLCGAAGVLVVALAFARLRSARLRTLRAAEITDPSAPPETTRTT